MKEFYEYHIDISNCFCHIKESEGLPLSYILIGNKSMPL